jgi:hypothetical protein
VTQVTSKVWVISQMRIYYGATLYGKTTGECGKRRGGAAMETRHIWTHGRTGETFVVAMAASGELTAARRLKFAEDPLQALLGVLTADAATLAFVQGVRRELHERYELDEEGYVWSFGPAVERDAA